MTKMADPPEAGGMRPPVPPEGLAETPAAIFTGGSMAFVRAFERNCPGVRMSKDEREELARLFWEAVCVHRPRTF